MTFIEKLKENWNKQDEICPSCKQIIKPAIGLNKQNLKRLFKDQTPQEWMILIIIILALIGAFAYQSEMKQYKEMINNPEDLCQFYYQNVAHGNFEDTKLIKILNTTMIPSDNYLPFKK